MTARIARRLFVTPLTVAAGSIGAISPVLDDVKLETVRIVIPPGHAGLTALQIKQGGVPIFPYGADPFIRGDDEVIDFAWDSEITANGLQVIGFNTDIFDHTWTIRWTLADLGNASGVVTIASPQATPVAPSDVATIAALTGTADAGADLSAADLAAMDTAGLATAAGP